MHKTLIMFWNQTFQVWFEKHKELLHKALNIVWKHLELLHKTLNIVWKHLE